MPTQVYRFAFKEEGDKDDTVLYADSYQALRDQLLSGRPDVIIKLGENRLSQQAWDHVVPPAAEAAMATRVAAAGAALPALLAPPLNLVVKYPVAGASSSGMFVDNTVEFAQRMVSTANLHKPAATATDLAAALFSALPQPFPLPPLFHQQLQLQGRFNPALDAALSNYTCSSNECNLFSYRVQQALEEINPAQGASEQDCILLLAPLSEKLLERIATWGGAGRITSARDLSDKTGYTEGEQRPDLLMYRDGKLILKMEHKSAAHQVQESLDECGEKMVAEWDILVFGSRKWLLCGATAGTLVQFAFILPGEQTAIPVGPQLDVSQVSDRIIFEAVMVNILRLAILTEADMRSNLQLGLIGGTTNGCSVTVHDGYVVKRVKEFSVRPNTCHAFEDLCRLYAFLGSGKLRGIVRCKGASKPKLLLDDTFSVSLVPLGYHKPPRTEAELREALLVPLFALSKVHEAGWTLRDIRDSNFLFGKDGYFFSDIDGAGRVEGIEGSKVAPELLDMNGRFLPVSDMMLVGKLFSGVTVTPKAGNGPSFRERLLRGEYKDAAAALEDEWFHRQ